MLRTETEIIEFKTSFSEWKEIIHTLCGFANKNGGTVIVGLDDKGQPTNLQIGKNTIEDFVNKLKNNTDPVLYPSINKKTFALGEIVEITIPKSDYKPVFAFGRAYTRVGKSTLKLSANEIRELSKLYTFPDFDKQATNIKFEDFDIDQKLISKINKKHFNFNEQSAAKEILTGFNLINKDKLLNAGYLSFVKENKLLKNGWVKAARFKGDKPVTFIDMQDFTGNIINAVDECINFVKKHINLSVYISGQAEREENWDYPLPALREAIINALVHRDYTDKGNIQVRIFDNSLEVWTPGHLPKEIDINNIANTNRSIPRNQLIADIFHAIHYIEAWGTGLIRIIEYSKSFGIPTPIFSHQQGAFVIRFMKRINEGINGEINKGINKGINEGINLLLQTIIENEGKRSNELAVLLNKPQKTIERWLSELKKTGKISYKGSKKTGGYYRT